MFIEFVIDSSECLNKIISIDFYAIMENIFL